MITVKVKSLPSVPKIKAESLFQQTITEMADYTKQQFEVSTRDFRHRPPFKQEIEPYSFFVYTNDDVYYMIQHGTRPHIIRARVAPRLAFRDGFLSKTSPSQLESRPGRRYGVWHKRLAVYHPGHEARDFEGKVRDRLMRLVPGKLQDLERRIISELSS